MSEELSEFERRLAAREAREAQNKQADSPPDWSEFVPDVVVQISEEDEQLDKAIKDMNIVDAYNRWCKKSKPDTRSGRQAEGIKVSCPNPSHPDRNPSAWLNTNKNLYYCSGCAEGGDVWDIAAWHFGYPVPGYKHDPVLFRELREKIGAELGFQQVKGLMGTYLVATGNEEQAVAPVVVPGPVTPVGMLPSAVVVEQEAQAAAAKIDDSATIDWRGIVPDGTFLRTWLSATTIDDCPEEYHFWTGLMAIGFAVGRNRILKDARPVIPNLFVCFVGPSGAGKSSAKGHLARIVQDTMPYEYDNPFSSGTKHISAPGSAEYLVKAFSAPIYDPAAPKKIMGYSPVRAQVDFEELAALIGISSRLGSTMKPTLLEIYDGSSSIGSGSLTHGERISRDPFGQVTSTTQDGSLRDLLKRGDEISGFMNRWVFASGKLKRQRSLGGAMIDLGDASAKLKSLHQWAGTTRALSMTPDAFTRWDGFFHDVVVPTKGASERGGSVLLNRIDLLLKKLILLFSCNLLQDEVSVEVVEQAIALFPYLLKSYGIVSKEMSITEESTINETITDAISKFIAANGRGPTMRELYPTVKKLGTQSSILSTIKNMVSLAIISEVPSPTGQRGRPTVRYVVNE